VGSTNLSHDQYRRLESLISKCPEAYLLLDNDPPDDKGRRAGREGAKKIMHKFLDDAGVMLNYVELPSPDGQKMDLADYFKEGGDVEGLDNSIDLPSMIIADLNHETGYSPRLRMAVQKELFPVLYKVPDSDATYYLNDVLGGKFDFKFENKRDIVKYYKDSKKGQIRKNDAEPKSDAYYIPAHIIMPSVDWKDGTLFYLIDRWVVMKEDGKYELQRFVITSKGECMTLEQFEKNERYKYFDPLPIPPKPGKHSDKLPVPDAEQWAKGQPRIDKWELFNEAVDFYVKEKDVVVPDIRWVEFWALWSFSTFVYPMFETATMIIIHAPKGSGKSRVLDVTRGISFSPVNLSGATGAAFMRTIEASRGTVFIDEAEYLLDDKSDLIDRTLLTSLNLSYKNAGSEITRCSGDDHQPETYSAFGPKMLASINQINDTSFDRMIPFYLPRHSGANIKYKPSKLAPFWTAHRIKKQLFMLENAEEVARCEERLLNDYEDMLIERGIFGRELELVIPVLTMALFFSEDLFLRTVDLYSDIAEHKKQRRNDAPLNHLMLETLRYIQKQESSLLIFDGWMLEADLQAHIKENVSAYNKDWFSRKKMCDWLYEKCHILDPKDRKKIDGKRSIRIDKNKVLEAIEHAGLKIEEVVDDGSDEGDDDSAIQRASEGFTDGEVSV